MLKFGKVLLALAISISFLPSLVAARTVYDPATGHYYKVNRIVDTNDFYGFHSPVRSVYTTTQTYHLNRHVSLSTQTTHIDNFRPVNRFYTPRHNYNTLTVAYVHGKKKHCRKCHH